MQDITTWLVQLGTLTDYGSGASYKSFAPEPGTTGAPRLVIVAKVENVNGTDYITELVVGDLYPECSTARLHLAIRLKHLPELLRGLPKLRWFSCVACCGSALTQDRWLPQDLPQAAAELEGLALLAVGWLACCQRPGETGQVCTPFFRMVTV
jgi:hypothetical protein